MAFAESDSKKDLLGQADVERECDAIENQLQALRAAYEQFFLGMERHPPSKQHDALKRSLAKVRNAFVRSTAAQFRLAAVTARMQTYERMWARTIEQMENGTYRRDLFKARLRNKPQQPQKKQAPPELEKDLPPEVEQPQAKPESSLEASLRSTLAPAKGKLPAIPAVAKAGASVAKTALNDTRLREVYDAYVMAKKRCNEDTSKLSYDSLASTLKKQVPELLKKHNAKDVDFKVIIKDGKAVLKAVPKT